MDNKFGWAVTLPPVRWALLSLLAGPLSALQAHADEQVAAVEFNQDFLRSPVDVRMFAEGNPVSAGLHRIDLFMNGRWKGRLQVRFEKPTPHARVARPCYDLQLLDLLGFALDQLQPATRQALEQGALCQPLSDFFNGAQATFDSAEQRLNASSPQLQLQRRARGWVDPQLWDNGITAGTLQYSYNAYHSSYATHSYTSQYLGLRAGVNVGAWRLRYRSSANWSNDEGLHYENSLVYAERGLADWRSKITVGEASTDGQVFDSIGFLGVQLASDDRMYVDSQRGFAPVVRGIANTNARVQVSQRGMQIYETTVPPGPFIIDDLYPTGSGGDLLVTVTEADGSEHSFTVTYASIAELLRPGVTRYSLMAGQYRNSIVHDKPALAMGTLRHGFTNMVTGYSGLVAAEGYAAASLGVALNTQYGAIATDLTHARTRLEGKSLNGQSLRLTYAKILPVLRTNVTLASYRYSTSSYYDVDEAFLHRERAARGDTDSVVTRLMERRRNRFVISATQTLPNNYGSIGISGSTQDYWGRSGTDTEYQMSYNKSFRNFSLGLALSRTRDTENDRWDNQFTVTFSMPLGRQPRAPNLSTTYTHERDSQSAHASVNGSLGEARQYSYNAFTTLRDNDSESSRVTGGASGTWAAPYASVGGSISAGSGYQQYGASLRGGVVVYGGGVVLAPSLGDTVAIVEADQAAGARLTNYSGLKLGGQGRAVVPYLSPYRRNSVEIDPKGLSTDIELKSTSQHVAPTAGAITLLRFETESGYSMLIGGRTRTGEPLPFGASVLDAQGQTVGYVAQAGQALVRVGQQEGELQVTWGEGEDQSCRLPYALDPQSNKNGLRHVRSTCL